jgi:6-pyruvoyltetrahydropterin/6-carboxytetrahydropterin synthase
MGGRVELRRLTSRLDAAEAATVVVARGAGVERRRCDTRLQRDYRFESAHFLPKVPPGHKCARMHGHSYAVTVLLEGEVDPQTGWLIDFADIDDRVAPVIRMIDHRVLNEIDGLANPTSELLAAWLWRRIVDVLPGMVELTVVDTPTSRCVYRGT